MRASANSLWTIIVHVRHNGLCLISLTRIGAERENGRFAMHTSNLGKSTCNASPLILSIVEYPVSVDLLRFSFAIASSDSTQITRDASGKSREVNVPVPLPSSITVSVDRIRAESTIFSIRWSSTIRYWPRPLPEIMWLRIPLSTYVNEYQSLDVWWEKMRNHG